MRKQLQVNTGNGWNNLSSEFYERGRKKEEDAAQLKMEKYATGWPLAYEPYRHAQFRVIDSDQ